MAANGIDEDRGRARASVDDGDGEGGLLGWAGRRLEGGKEGRARVRV